MKVIFSGKGIKIGFLVVERGKPVAERCEHNNLFFNKKEDFNWRAMVEHGLVTVQEVQMGRKEKKQ